MKNSVKFFLGGIAVAILIFAAFAFTTKQTENKEYLVIRIEENALSNLVIVQICDKNGRVNYSEEKVSKIKRGIFDDTNAVHTAKFSVLINEYSQKGYKLSSSNIEMIKYNGSTDSRVVYSTLIFEK